VQAGRVQGVAERSGQAGAALRGCQRQVRVAEVEPDLLELQAKRVGGQLGHDRAGAGADVGRRARHSRRAVPPDRGPGLAGQLSSGVVDPGHAVADQPAAVAHRAGLRVAAWPAELLRRNAASCGLGHASPVSRSADLACVRHLLLVSAAETVIGRGCELGGGGPARRCRLRPPGSAPGVFPGHRASGPWQVLAGMWCITVCTRGQLSVAGDWRDAPRRPGPGRGNAVRIPGGAMWSPVCSIGSGSPPPAGHTGVRE
jgi:hypothetical protein